MLACTLLTYPLAYRRRVRQLIEGSAAVNTTASTNTAIRHILHATILRQPPQRAVFHFISQTILRSQRQRITLAMFGGLSVAIALAQMIVFAVEPGHVHATLLPQGIRSAVPIMIFLTVIGLRSAIVAPVDRRGSWLFSVIIGRPRSAHLAGTSIWITLIALIIGMLHGLVPSHALAHALKIPRITTGQILVAVRPLASPL